MLSGSVLFGPMSILRSSMDHRVKPGGDESYRSRDALRIRALPKQKASPKTPPLKEGRRSAERRTTGPHRKAMRRAPSLLSSHCGRTEVAGTSKKWSGRARLSAPHRGIRGFGPRLGSGRASWNHRMQTGGPSPAPVQRAPRSPTRAGRDDAQAARERSVSLRPREPLPLRPKEYPRERRPFASGMVVM
jgi:hypothetical protein